MNSDGPFILMFLALFFLFLAATIPDEEEVDTPITCQAGYSDGCYKLNK